MLENIFVHPNLLFSEPFQQFIAKSSDYHFLGISRDSEADLKEFEINLFVKNPNCGLQRNKKFNNPPFFQKKMRGTTYNSPSHVQGYSRNLWNSCVSVRYASRKMLQKKFSVWMYVPNRVGSDCKQACKHRFCSSCLRKFYSFEKIKSCELTCPVEGCKAFLPLTVIMVSLDSNLNDQ
jgi:hypothetical protein